MFKKICIFGLIVLLSACGSNTTQTDEDKTQEVFRVACVGDSITYGTSISNRAVNSYPAQLKQLLGDNIEVGNFGKPGATLITNGDRPYVKQGEYGASKSFAPDVVVIMLGTNDTKSANWGKIGSFNGDYISLINTYKSLDSEPTIYICLPPPVFNSCCTISNARLNNLLSRIRNIANETGVQVIDNNTILQGKSSYFSDGVHPTKEGAKLIAEEVYKTIY